MECANPARSRSADGLRRRLNLTRRTPHVRFDVSTSRRIVQRGLSHMADADRAARGPSDERSCCVRADELQGEGFALFGASP